VTDDRACEAIVIGASAGAFEALSVLLPALPAGYALPVLIVVHMRADTQSVLADLFDAKCAIAVREAEDKAMIAGGTAYFAPPDYHLLVEKDRSLALSNEEPVFFSRPSIDVLFESAADAYGPGLTGIILTGANQDGAKGLRAVVEAGGRAIVQTPASASAAAMPQAAIAQCPQAQVMTLDDIAAHLKNLGRKIRS